MHVENCWQSKNKNLSWLQSTISQCRTGKVRGASQFRWEETGNSCGLFQSVLWSSVERLRIRQKMPRWWYQVGIGGVGGFLTHLTLNQGVKREGPAVPFHGGDKPIGSSLNDEVKIFVTPSQHSRAKFREIFTDMNGTLTSGEEAKKSLARRNMNYWPQQLNFVFWWTKSGCGIPRETLD